MREFSTRGTHSPLYAPQGDHGFALPSQKEVPNIKAIEEDIFGGVLMRVAFECGATTRDIAELLSKYYRLPHPRVLDTLSFRDFLGNFGRTLDKNGPSRREQYLAHLQTLYPASTAEVAKISNALTETVRTRVREHSPRDFWQNDALARACMIPLLERMQQGTVGTQDIHFVLSERLGIDMTYKALYGDFFKYKKQYQDAAFVQTLHTTPVQLDANLAAQARTLVEQWLKDLDVIREHGTLNESHSEWKRNAGISMVVAGLFEISFPEEKLLRRKIARGLVPITSISRIIESEYGTPAHTDSFKKLLGSDAYTPETYRHAAQMLRKIHGIAEDSEYAMQGKRDAEALWDKYFAAVDARSRLEAQVFRSPSATALAVALLEQTDFPMLRIARIVEARYAIEITPDQFGMIVRRLGGRQHAATYIRNHATYSQTQYESIQHAIPGIVEFEKSIDTDKRIKRPEITQFIAGFRSGTLMHGVHVAKTDIVTGLRDADGLPVLKPSLQVMFEWPDEVHTLQLNQNRELLTALVCSVRELQGGVKNELAEGLKKIGCVGVVVYATRSRSDTYKQSRQRLAWYVRNFSPRLKRVKSIVADQPSAPRQHTPISSQERTDVPQTSVLGRPSNSEPVPVGAVDKLLATIRSGKTAGRISITEISQLARYDAATQTMEMRKVLVISLPRISGDVAATSEALAEKASQKEYLLRAFDEIAQGVPNTLTEIVLSKGYQAVALSSEELVSRDSRGIRKEWEQQRKTVVFPESLLSAKK